MISELCWRVDHYDDGLSLIMHPTYWHWWEGRRAGSN